MRSLAPGDQHQGTSTELGWELFRGVNQGPALGRDLGHGVFSSVTALTKR
jgi:hypothetical protein